MSASLDVEGLLFDFKGTSVIPHFGQLPGWSITTSGCITQVYFCAEAGGVGEGFAIPFIAAEVIAAAIRIKICLCMLKLKMEEMRERAAQSSATNMCRGGCLSRSEFAREDRAPKS